MHFLSVMVGFKADGLHLSPLASFSENMSLSLSFPPPPPFPFPLSLSHTPLPRPHSYHNPAIITPSASPSRSPPRPLPSRLTTNIPQHNPPNHPVQVPGPGKETCPPLRHRSNRRYHHHFSNPGLPGRRLTDRATGLVGLDILSWCRGMVVI